VSDVPEDIRQSADYINGLHAYSVQFGIPPEDVPAFLHPRLGEAMTVDGILGTGRAWGDGTGSLTWRELSISTVSTMIAAGGLEQRLRFHFRWAMTNGLSAEELQNLIRFLGAYVGFPKASIAMEELRAVLAEGAEQ
jgi:alkylhydroperoxidase/carboxymuconolactone decarboxylase family protein YurZ